MPGTIAAARAPVARLAPEWVVQPFRLLVMRRAVQPLDANAPPGHAHVHALAHELGVRVAVAVVALPIVGVLLWMGHGYAAALFALGGAIASFEYYRLTPLRSERLRWVGITASAALPALPFILSQTWQPVALAIVVATSMATWSFLVAYGPRREAPAHAGHVLAGVAFVASGLTALAVLRARPDGLAWSVIVLAAAWANDTGAFLGGKLLGSHLLLPSVSPGKTREGLAVGAIVGTGGALVTHLCFSAISRDDAIVIAIITAVLGPIGDLSKSMLKRAAGVKESGSLFLAHGGMLDRIDAVLFDAVGVLAYVTLAHR